jgi:hypothetical protein
MHGETLKYVQVHFLVKINLGNQCVCWFYYKELYYNARSHERKIEQEYGALAE